MTHLTPDQLAAAALPMEPTQVRDAVVRAHLDGELDAPENASAYSTVRHGLAKAIPLVLAAERARVLALVRASFPPDVALLIEETIRPTREDPR